MSEQLTASYFLRAWHDASRSSKPDDGAQSTDGESSPKALDTQKGSRGFALIGPDRLSASYPHVSKHMHDVGIVQADRPAPRKRLVYYFEVFVKNSGSPARVSVGFTSVATSPNIRHHPGWEAGSCGYYGSDGMVYRGQGEGETFGPTVAIGDTVGCGVNYATNQFLFTKNGVLIGSVEKNVEGPLFPTIGLQTEHEEVTVNFGKKPFLFYLKAYEAAYRAELRKTIDEMEIPRCHGFRMVRSYLKHYGYEETLLSFDLDTETAELVQENVSNEEADKYALSQRKGIRQMIMRGQVDDAITMLDEWFPDIMQNHLSPIFFFLHSLKFVELVRANKKTEAIVLGRIEFDKFRSVLQIEDQVQDCASLLVNEQPHKSDVRYLLEKSHRELVADAVNATILSSNPKRDEEFCAQSSLERLIRQLTTCFLARRALNMHQGEAFDLRIFLARRALNMHQGEAFDLRRFLESRNK
ncbi:ran-binding protein M homolog [Henckelia pumila]|uniref:ran-binding protein M homolog n=1 Tax=Henckelia pumila TaxID=405737 RepID=UPI003C6E7911